MKNSKISTKLIPFCIFLQKCTTDPTNFFLIFFKKIKLNFSVLNPLILQLTSKQCFLFLKKNIKVKNPIIYVFNIENSQLRQIISFFFLKKNIYYLDSKKDIKVHEYNEIFKKKNLIIVSLFLPSEQYVNLQKLAVKMNIPLISFTTLDFSKFSSQLNCTGAFSLDYAQFLIILMLILLYEKI